MPLPNLRSDYHEKRIEHLEQVNRLTLMALELLLGLGRIETGPNRAEHVRAILKVVGETASRLIPFESYLFLGIDETTFDLTPLGGRSADAAQHLSRSWTRWWRTAPWPWPSRAPSPISPATRTGA
jgi:hypothetical protein